MIFAIACRQKKTLLKIRAEGGWESQGSPLQGFISEAVSSFAGIWADQNDCFGAAEMEVCEVCHL